MKAILDAVARLLKEKTGLDVLYDPQPLRGAEPHIRLTFMGTEEWGKGSIAANFQLSIIGAGDGPGTYLDKIIKSSAKLSLLYGGYNEERSCILKVNNYTIRISYCSGLAATGTFTANEAKEVETNHWSYVFNETRQLQIIIPMEVL